MKTEITSPSHTVVHPPAHPRVAVVLGMVGIRAAAAIPLFELLEEEQIEVDLLVGSSGGAWLTAMRGAGYHSAQMHEVIEEMCHRKFFSKVDWQTIAGIAHPKLVRPGISSALRKMDRQLQLARRLFGERRLEDLWPTTVLQTADSVAGEAVALSQGAIAEAVCASSAMMPYFPPQYIAGRWLADGAYVMPVPIMEAVKRHADVIIALYHEEEPKPQPSDLLEANYNILAAYFSRLVKDQTMMAIDLHHHEIILLPLKLEPYIGPWETRAVPRLLDAGRQLIARRREEILSAVRAGLPSLRA